MNECYHIPARVAKLKGTRCAKSDEAMRSPTTRKNKEKCVHTRTCTQEGTEAPESASPTGAWGTASPSSFGQVPLGTVTPAHTTQDMAHRVAQQTGVTGGSH